VFTRVARVVVHFRPNCRILPSRLTTLKLLFQHHDLLLFRSSTPPILVNALLRRQQHNVLPSSQSHTCQAPTPMNHPASGCPAPKAGFNAGRQPNSHLVTLLPHCSNISDHNSSFSFAKPPIIISTASTSVDALVRQRCRDAHVYISLVCVVCSLIFFEGIWAKCMQGTIYFKRVRAVMEVSEGRVAGDLGSGVCFSVPDKGWSYTAYH